MPEPGELMRLMRSVPSSHRRSRNPSPANPGTTRSTAFMNSTMSVIVRYGNALVISRQLNGYIYGTYVSNADLMYKRTKK